MPSSPTPSKHENPKPQPPSKKYPHYTASLSKTMHFGDWIFSHCGTCAFLQIDSLWMRRSVNRTSCVMVGPTNSSAAWCWCNSQRTRAPVSQCLVESILEEHRVIISIHPMNSCSYVMQCNNVMAADMKCTGNIDDDSCINFPDFPPFPHPFIHHQPPSRHRMTEANRRMDPKPVSEPRLWPRIQGGAPYKYLEVPGS